MARHGTVEIVAGEIDADHLAQLCQGIFRLDQLIELVLEAVGLGLRAADEGADAGQDLDLVRAAVEGAGLPLDVRVEGLGGVQRLMRGEDGFRKARGESAAVVGGAGLHIDRPALRRARDVQRAANAKMLADVVERMDLAGIGEDARGRIVDERVVLPAVPEPRDHVEIFAGALVALVVGRVLGQSKVLRGLWGAGRHDIPAGAALAQVVERGEHAREIVGLGIGGRCRRDQANALRHCGDRRQPGDRLEAKALGVADIVGKSRAVGKEDGVELARLSALRQLLIIADVENALRRRSLVAPRGFVMATGIDEEIENKLPLIAHVETPRMRPAQNLCRCSHYCRWNEFALLSSMRA